MKVAASLFLLGAIALPVSAQEIKVDINNSGRPVSEGNDPAYTPWSTNQTWFAGGDTTLSMFGGVTITFTRVGTNGTSLVSGYWKEGVQGSPPSGTLYNCKLAGDGLKVNNGDTGAARIEMRLSGLSPGPHTLLTYHNNWDNHAAFTVTPLNIYVDGVQAVTNLAQTVRVTSSSDAATAYLEVNATAGQDVVVLFEASTATGATKGNVWINGFEIDTPNSSLKAVKPYPDHADRHVDADNKTVLLRWTAAGTALSHDVYFGTDSNAVRNATHASPEYKGNQAAANFLATNLSSLLTYFWRIDEVHPGPEITRGDVWMFQPRHLAFPGAEGYGRFARGGRGGVVVKVTNLNDSGPGSLRDAIEGDYGPRTVVFDVSGLITLSSDVVISGNMPPMTVAGQTAPGKGICVKRQQFAMSGARDAIVRFMRVRVGKESGETQNASGMAGVQHSIMDHCSVSWGIDEEISSRGALNMTLQRTLIAEALNIAGHDNYPPGTAHGYAASIGGDIASFHHNLLAHCAGRNWSLAGGLDGAGYFAGRLDIFNNVVYNWRHRTTDGGAHEVNFVNNYYKPGPAITQTRILNAQYDNFPGTQQYYFVGNVMPGYHQTSQQANARTASGYVPTTYSPWVDAPFFPSYAAIDEVTNAYKRVLSDVGCNLPMMDNTDSRIIRETVGGTYTYTGSVSGLPGLPDTTADVGGWEDYGNEARPAGWDTDNDGLPNWWEEIHGLNPNSAPGDFSDSNGDPDGDEYTHLEDYLNWMAQPHVDCSAGSTVDVDLHGLSRGFTNSGPNYAFSNVTNGTVTLISARHARFSPATSASALGSFNYTVTDSQGYHMTRTVNVRIIGTVEPSAPVLGIRNEGGVLKIELTSPSGRATAVETATELGGWSTWTNVTGSGTMQLLPLDELTNQSPRFFRAVSP